MSLLELIGRSGYLLHSAMVPLVCSWITDEDRERVGSILVEASDFVEELVGRRPDLRGIPVEPTLSPRADPGDLVAHVLLWEPTRRMRLRVNFAIGRREPINLFVVLAHELAHILHEQARGDISGERIDEAERFAFVITRAAASRCGVPHRVDSDAPGRATSPHWRAWKWSRDRHPDLGIAWARRFVLAAGPAATHPMEQRP